MIQNPVSLHRKLQGPCYSPDHVSRLSGKCDAGSTGIPRRSSKFQTHPLSVAYLFFWLRAIFSAIVSMLWSSGERRHVLALAGIRSAHPRPHSMSEHCEPPSLRQVIKLSIVPPKLPWICTLLLSYQYNLTAPITLGCYAPPLIDYF